MKRRWFIPAAVLAAMALALGACGGDDGGGTEEGDGEVTIFSLWTGSEEEAFKKVLTQFTEETGIRTKYEAARDFLPVIRTRLNAGNPPEVGILPRPGFVDELARDEALIPLEDLGLDVDAINENYGDTWIDLATFEDTAYGVVAKANSKSTVWYKPNSFQQNGFEVPQTWDQLEQIVQSYKSKGEVPWAVGAQGRDSSWTLTDWFEQIYIRTAGGDNYDKLFSGELPFNDATVKEALEIMLQQVNDENVLNGVDGALSLSFQDAITRVFGTNPQAEMHMLGGFTGGIAIGANPDLKPGETIDFFPFPTIKEEHGDPLVGSGDVAAAFVNNEDVAKLLEFLSTPEAGRTWVSTGAIVSPNKGVPDDAYPNELVRKEADQVKNAESFRFDGSDLLPGTLGQDFGTLLQNVIKNPNNVDSLLDDYQAEAEQAFS
ncbi:MAG: carbohydrate transporter substrate-binding protein [Gaiellaceae bacterium]|jgi:alpha-glucoside transport system substrate-binding protein|nr:carbohydrate transporter substrate-binding protein [Gaiellaceae bacterium]